MPEAMISVQCPSCEARMRAKESAAGKRTTCPKCKRPFTIEAPPPPEEEEALVEQEQEQGEEPEGDGADEGEDEEESPRPAQRRAAGGNGRAAAVRRGGTSGASAAARRRVSAPPARGGSKAGIWVLLALLLLGGGGAAYYFLVYKGAGGGGSTPEAAFEKFQNAVAAKNWGGLWDCMAPSVRKEADAQWEQAKAKLDGPEGEEAAKEMKMSVADLKKMTPRDMFVKVMGAMSELMGDMSADAKGSTVVGKRIEGHRCWLKVKDAKGIEGELEMVKEEGLWYVAKKFGM